VAQQGLGQNYEAAKANREKNAALGKVSRPEDTAQAILSLVSADLVTGQTLIVDGGGMIGAKGRWP
jgi:NAD(P)-dependent dehydrogenase (short-subunit alcohol dehydrogenase family)